MLLLLFSSGLMKLPHLLIFALLSAAGSCIPEVRDVGSRTEERRSFVSNGLTCYCKKRV
jgi:hypothetical protein